MSMKRPGAGARDSPTKDRYGGKRQQQPGRGGRRQKPGSRDVSPAPPTWSPLHSVPAATTTTAAVALSPHQLALQQQHLTEIAAKTPVSDLIVQIRRLTFPASCAFVLNLLEKYVKAHLTNDAMLKISLPKKIPLLTLLNYFILCQPVSLKVARKKAKVEQRPQPHTPMEELQVMVSVVKKIEEQTNNIEQQFYMFEALFGGCTGIIKTGVRAGETFFERVVCFAVSIQSVPVFSCIAVWMQVHPSEALSLSHSLYSCFCEHLPNASEPLMQLATLSPQLAKQLVLSYTKLYPFYIVGTPVPGVDPTHLQPPKILLVIISNWIEKIPRFLYAAHLIEKTDLISFHGAASTSKVAAAAPTNGETSVSPLAGLMRWCTLAPCHHKQDATPKGSQETIFELQSHSIKDQTHSNGSTSNAGGKETSVKPEDFQTLIAKLHANLLSVILSDSQSFPRETLVGDHVAVTVAALLGLSNYQPTQLKKRGKLTTTSAATTTVAETEYGESGEKNQLLDESVERLAQFLQISLSTGLLVLSPDNLSSMASTLPINKLLTLVIAHHSSRR